ncbi:MAG: glycosyltransferase family 4 protein [Myxococcales bacterium]
MAAVLFVSKPIAPPWNDSGKNLVRDLARGLRRHRATLMVRGESDAQLTSADLAPIYRAHSGGFAPGLSDQARVMAHLLSSRSYRLWHFFFAPNPKSCLAGRIATGLRRTRSVHTLSSAPKDPRAIVPQLFADVSVALSRHTQDRLLNAGLAPERLVRIAPAIEPLHAPSAERFLHLRDELGLPRDAFVVVYPGDLEFGEGGSLCIEAVRALGRSDVRLVMACRTKTPRAVTVEHALKERVAREGLSHQVSFVGETRRIHDLLACADVVCLPSADLYAKMDYPLVLLEAMSLARTVIVAKGSAAEELCEGDAALSVEVQADALAAALTQLADQPHRRAQVGLTASRAVGERYTYTAMAAAYEALYDRLLV